MNTDAMRGAGAASHSESREGWSVGKANESTLARKYVSKQRRPRHHKEASTHGRPAKNAVSCPVARNAYLS